MLVKTFRVKRSKWLRGDVATSTLRNNRGKMCCVGFYAKAAGFKNEHILNIGGLDDISRVNYDTYKPLFKSKSKLEALKKGDTRTMGNIYACNDSGGLEDSDREKQLKKLFAKLGIKVEFVD